MKLRDWNVREAGKNPEFEAAAAEVEFAQSIADNLVDARIRAGLSQGELAARAHTTQARISEMETGDGNPTAETVSRVFAALGLVPTVVVQPLSSQRAFSPVPSSSTEDVGEMIAALTKSIEVSAIDLRGIRLAPRLSASTFEETAYVGIHEVSDRLDRVA